MEFGEIPISTFMADVDRGLVFFILFGVVVTFVVDLPGGRPRLLDSPNTLSILEPLTATTSEEVDFRPRVVALLFLEECHG